MPEKLPPISEKIDEKVPSISDEMDDILAAERAVHERLWPGNSNVQYVVQQLLTSTRRNCGHGHAKAYQCEKCVHDATKTYRINDLQASLVYVQTFLIGRSVEPETPIRDIALSYFEFVRNGCRHPGNRPQLPCPICLREFWAQYGLSTDSPRESPPDPETAGLRAGQRLAAAITSDVPLFPFIPMPISEEVPVLYPDITYLHPDGTEIRSVDGKLILDDGTEINVPPISKPEPTPWHERLMEENDA